MIAKSMWANLPAAGNVESRGNQQVSVACRLQGCLRRNVSKAVVLDDEFSRSFFTAKHTHHNTYNINRQYILMPYIPVTRSCTGKLPTSATRPESSSNTAESSPSMYLDRSGGGASKD